MDLKDIKLIASDMDGTFLDERSQMPAEFYDVYQELKELGVVFTAASGRQLYNLQYIFEPIKEEMGFIGDNGGYAIFPNGETVIRKLDTPALVKGLDIVMDEKETFPIICGTDCAYYIKKPATAFTQAMLSAYNRIERIRSLREIPDEETIIKLGMLDHRGVEKYLLPQFDGFSSDYQVKVSADYSLDLSTKEANKGYALREIQKSLGVTRDETMAFGDYLNDIEMIKSAKYGFAMENAHPELKKVASYIAPSNKDYGVIQLMKQVIQAKKEA